MTMSDEYPRFRTVLRGYDPTDVEEVLDELYSALEDAVEQIEELTGRESRQGAAVDALQAQLEASNDRVRALESERRSTAVPTYQSLGTRVVSILASAEAEAVEIRERALGEAGLARQEAKTAVEALQREMEDSAAQNRAQMEAALQAELAQHKARLEEARKDLADARNLASSIILVAREEAEKVRQQSERWVTKSQTHRMEVRSHIDQIRQLLVSAVTSEAGAEASNEHMKTPRIDPADHAGERQTATIEELGVPTAPMPAAQPASPTPPSPSHAAPDPAGGAPTGAVTPPA